MNKGLPRQSKRTSGLANPTSLIKRTFRYSEPPCVTGPSMAKGKFAKGTDGKTKFWGSIRAWGVEGGAAAMK